MQPSLDVVVVDDGSHDRSGAIALELGAAVVTHERNRGYGAALTSGYRYALERGYDIAIRMDADGQHDPAGMMAHLAMVYLTAPSETPEVEPAPPAE